MKGLNQGDGTISRDTEGELVKRAREGDRAAFECLVRLNYRSVAGTAFRLIGNPEDAEDLAQECFVRAHANLRWLRAEGSFAAWLRRIVVHLARDRFRTQGRRPRNELVDVEGLIGREGEPGCELRARELALLLEEAVRRLPESQRLAFLLRTREQLGYREIADATGVTVNTARTQVQRARRTLLQRMGRHLGARIARIDRLERSDGPRSDDQRGEEG